MPQSAFLAECAQTCAQLARQLVNNNLVYDDEMICDLQCEGLLCLQKKRGYGITNDSVLLANFSVGITDEVGLEFCSGSGVISILANAKYHPKSIKMLEIQQNVATMSGRALEINGIKNIEVECADLVEYCETNSENKVDFILANPPYFKVGCGKMPQSDEKKLSKYEVQVSLQQIFDSAYKVLKPGGRLIFVHSYSRINEIIVGLKLRGFTIARECAVRVKANTAPHIILIEAVFGKVDSHLKLDDIVLLDDNNQNSEQYNSICAGTYFKNLT